MTNAKYHKSASKDVRPFFEAATLEEAIDAAQIRLFENQPFTEATSFIIEEQEVTRLRISAIVDACFRLIADGISAPSWTRGGCAQARCSMYLSRPRSA